eukprot:642867-Pyramimonas_sp.AAC.1
MSCIISVVSYKHCDTYPHNHMIAITLFSPTCPSGGAENGRGRAGGGEGSGRGNVKYPCPAPP